MNVPPYQPDAPVEPAPVATPTRGPGGGGLSKYLPMLAILAVLAVLVVGCALPGYNDVVTLDEKVDASWAQVENQLQRRYDLIPNLVETVKGIADQEKDLFVGVAEARNQYNSASTVDGKVAAANQLEGFLGRLLAIREAYPELKSNESFLKLQDQLEGTENRIAVERGRYNETARELNTYVRRFPGRLYASFAGVDERDYFELSDPAAGEAPKVNFDS